MSFGVVFLLDNPNLPPITLTLRLLLFITPTTSKYNGSPKEPGSLVRSSTAIFSTVTGKTSNKYLDEKGRYKWTSINPTSSPFSFKVSIVSLIVSQTEPIATITRVAVLLP